MVSFNMHLHTFQCNSATQHVMCISGCQNYPGHLIGCEHGALACMLTHLESSQFCVWEYLKPKVCASLVHSRKELWDQIQQFACKIITL
jgi:hypothetical protein